jgi:hypothetical protein
MLVIVGQRGKGQNSAHNGGEATPAAQLYMTKLGDDDKRD